MGSLLTRQKCLSTSKGCLGVARTSINPVGPLKRSRAKATFRLKIATPQLLSGMGTTFEYLAFCQALYQGDNLNHAVGWNRLYREMNMVFMSSYFQKLQLVALCNFLTNHIYFLIYQIIEYHTTVFRWKYQASGGLLNPKRIKNTVIYQSVSSSHYPVMQFIISQLLYNVIMI